MRALVVGASGFVGSALMRAITKDGHEAVGTYCRTEREGLYPLDITDESQVLRLIDEVGPQLIFHPAAQPNVDRCEKEVEESYGVNVDGTRNVARAAERARARYVYFSTDYVFDGREGPYPVDAEPAPLNVYGRHKLEAERFIQETVTKHVIVRVCGVYGFHQEGKNFVMALLAKGRRGEKMNVPSDQWGTPTYVENLAEAVTELGLSDYVGIAHPVGPDYLVRIDFARLGAEILGLDPSFLCPMTTDELNQPARRPLRGGVDNTSTQALLATHLIGAREGLETFKHEMEERTT